ncbi:type IV toxin-antitoxin system AbiEi family antitoxin domain-containing protein [Candidatus Rariloculus sp.]|uniref:type IV toxin-antitoxin system AbiEi family antitoxin domain-containing protein n=1 Tax=Candidatus Rariloculus sp. TaxID=3101265 RepID=UPI003D0F730F
MRFQELVQIVADEPVFETGLLLAGNVDATNLRRQLSRWTNTGCLLQLRRGLYALAPPWQKIKPHPFLVANRLAPVSYVSGLSALAFAQVIPEYVAEVTSCTGGRPRTYRTALGRFSFRHLKAGLRFGYRQVALGGGQAAFVAEPEKALVDLIYLRPGGDDAAFLGELRLNLEVLRFQVLDDFARQSAVPKLVRAAKRIGKLSRQTPERVAL